MAELRNKRSFLQLFSGMEQNLQGWLLNGPKKTVADLRLKLRDLPKTNFDLGCDFAEQGKWKDALFRFKVTLYLQPNYTQAHYHSASCYLRLGNRAKAKQALLQTLRLAPDHADALFMLSALDPKMVPPSQLPTRMSANIVRPFFGSLAAQYDAVEAANHYQGGQVAFEACKPLLNGRTGLALVDLGCGSGIASRPWRGLATEISGVDFTPEMVTAARALKLGDAPLFTRVLEEDLLAADGSAAPLAQADMVLLVNVAQFLGDVAPLLARLKAAMKPGALLAITTETFDTPAGYAVNIDTGRFGHHPEYIKTRATPLGFSIAHEARVQLYPNFNAQLIVLRA